MKKILPILFLLLGMLLLIKFVLPTIHPITGAPPYYVEGDTAPDRSELLDEYAYLKNWKRPDGPPKVGLQAGHYKNENLPEELERLKGNTGASGGGRDEWEVNLAIAEQTKELLEEQGITVDILPATVPQNYWADVFVAIHADGNLDFTKTGYKAAAPRRDLTGNATSLVDAIEKNYQKETGLAYDPNVTRNMRGYYAFSYWRFDHTLHPMTTAAILETGFLTNPYDREIIVDQPELSAKGLANGVIEYLKLQKLLSSN